MNIQAKQIQQALLDPPRAIAEAEQAWRGQTAAVAAQLLADPAARILLVAGPSSSGKTTTANILRDRLSAAGRPSAVISLDDFYRPLEEPDYPRLANGEHDFESPDAIDLPAVRECLAAFLRGEDHPLPRFDFRIRRPIKAASTLHVPPDGFLIVEGLHALNPRILDALPTGACHALFVSVSTNILGEDGSVLLSGRKLRFLRRLVRDSLYRSSDAARTYTLWQSVLAGEDRYLYPHRGNADITLDSFHLYEVALLRPFAEPLLAADGAPRTDYTAAVAAAMQHFAPLSAALVPDSSLLREFIPGGLYEALY